MVNINEPLLSDQDKQNIDQALSSSESLKEHIKRAKTAGIDVTQVENRLSESIQKLRAIRGAFFPNV